MSWHWESYKPSHAVGPPPFYFSTLAYFQKREHYLAVLWKTFLLSWTCSCAVLWHYIKLSCFIRHLDLFYFTLTCCQPLFLAKCGAQPKTNHCSCFGFKCLTSVISSSLQFWPNAKCTSLITNSRKLGFVMEVLTQA